MVAQFGFGGRGGAGDAGVEAEAEGAAAETFGVEEGKRGLRGVEGAEGVGVGERDLGGVGIDAGAEDDVDDAADGVTCV